MLAYLASGVDVISLLEVSMKKYALQALVIFFCVYCFLIIYSHVLRLCVG